MPASMLEGAAGFFKRARREVPDLANWGQTRRRGSARLACPGCTPCVRGCSTLSPRAVETKPASRRVRATYPRRSSDRASLHFLQFGLVMYGPWVARAILAVKTSIVVSEWLNGPDCAPAPPVRPFLDRNAAPPSLVSRMVRKAIGMTTAAPRSAESLTWISRSARLPPAIALALTLAEE